MGGMHRLCSQLMNILIMYLLNNVPSCMSILVCITPYLGSVYYSMLAIDWPVNFFTVTCDVASVPGLPRSVRVLIMRMRQTFDRRKLRFECMPHAHN